MRQIRVEVVVGSNKKTNECGLLQEYVTATCTSCGRMEQGKSLKQAMWLLKDRCDPDLKETHRYVALS